MENEKEITQEEAKNNKKKMKNLVSTIIILAGLLIGSLFVDVAQLIKGSGFSEKNLGKTDIFESKEKTWVAYTEPIVNVKVISDDSCEKCDPSEVLVWLRRVLPTISAQKISYDSEEGKNLVSQLEVKSLPALVFGESVNKTDFFGQAQVLFDQKDKLYKLKTQELGLEPGKYLELPKISDGDAIFGKTDSKVKVVLFSDFQCPYSKLFYKSFRDTMKQYGDKVAFVYKHLPLSFHQKANDAALASSCALEQNKFWEYSDKLYLAQNEWGSAKDNQIFKNYARVSGLNAVNFGKCLDDKKYQENIDADINEGGNFGISGTPAIFINDQFKNGVVSVADLKTAIDAELEK